MTVNNNASRISRRITYARQCRVHRIGDINYQDSTKIIGHICINTQNRNVPRISRGIVISHQGRVARIGNIDNLKTGRVIRDEGIDT